MTTKTNDPQPFIDLIPQHTRDKAARGAQNQVDARLSDHRHLCNTTIDMLRDAIKLEDYLLQLHVECGKLFNVLGSSELCDATVDLDKISWEWVIYPAWEDRDSALTFLFTLTRSAVQPMLDVKLQVDTPEDVWKIPFLRAGKPCCLPFDTVHVALGELAKDLMSFSIDTPRLLYATNGSRTHFDNTFQRSCKYHMDHGVILELDKNA